MSNCRCDEIGRIKKDINTLGEICGRANILADNDSYVAQDFEYLGKACGSAFFSRGGFTYKIGHLNGRSTQDIETLRQKIDTLSEQLETDLATAKKEDDDYHYEQLLKFLHLK